MAECEGNMQSRPVGRSKRRTYALDSEQLQQLEAEASADYESGRFERALSKYQAILVAQPEHAAALNRVGAILAQQGDLDAAESYLRHALAVDPNLAGAHSNLGNILLTRGDAQGALACYQQAVRLDPESPVFHENLAAAYKRLKDITNMVKALKKAQRLQAAALRREAREARDARRARGASVGKQFGCVTLIIVVVAATITSVVIFC